MDNDVNGKVNEYRQLHCQVQLNWIIKHFRECVGSDTHTMVYLNEGHYDGAVSFSRRKTGHCAEH